MMHARSLLTALCSSLTILLGLPVRGAVAADEYYFKQLSIREGLANSYVTSMLFARNGYVWFGTRNGLSRYDRSEFRNFTHEEGVCSSLPSDGVLMLEEDRKGTVWVGTDSGLATWDPMADRFDEVLFDGQSVQAYRALETGQSMLFGSIGALYEYDYGTEELRLLRFNTRSDSLFRVSAIARLSEKEILLSTRGDGLWVYELQERKFSRWEGCPWKNIVTVFVDSVGRIWVALHFNGVVCYDRSGEQLFRFTAADSDLSHDIVLDLAQKDGQIWIATDGGGINIFNMADNTLSHLTHIPGDQTSLPANSVVCLCNDLQRNIWAGTVRAGAIGIKKVSTRSYREVPPGDEHGLSSGVVIGMLEEADGSIWVGTDGGGINRYDPKTGKFRHYPRTYGQKVISFIRYSEEEFLLSLYSKQMVVFNKRTGELSPLNISMEGIKPHQGVVIPQLSSHTEGQIDIFAQISYNYDISTGTTRPLLSLDRSSLASTTVISKGQYFTWLFDRKGIFKVNNKEGSYSKALSFEKGMFVNAASTDENGRMWIGTNKGLLCWDTGSRIDTVSSSLFSDIALVMCDGRGRVWLASGNRLYSYIMAERRFVLLDESDGIPACDYIGKSVLVTKDYLYLGTTTGLLRIDRTIDLRSGEPYGMRIMDITMNGESLHLGDKNSRRKLSLPYNHSPLTIKLSSDNQDLFHESVFRYTLRPGDTPAVIHGQDIVLRSLSAGSYELSVSGMGRTGDWSDPAVLFSLTINPPWWKSDLFTISALLLAMGALTALSYGIVRKERRRNLRQMEEHRRISQEETIQFLINISHELRTPLTLILAPLKRLLGQKEEGDPGKVLSGIFRQAKKMQNIINMVLDARKMETGKGTLQFRPHDLNEWLRGVAADFQIESASRGISIAYDLDENVKTVAFDQDKIEIVVSNMLINALKFGKPGSVILISTQATPDADAVKVCIKDRGIGIDGLDLSKLFTPFYQGAYAKAGSGIGLSYSKALVGMHRGKIGACSNDDGQGATFWFELPLRAQPDGMEYAPKSYLEELFLPSTETMPAEIGIDTRSYTVLVVEDEPELCEFLKKALSGEFKQVITAGNGKEALDIVLSTPPDIVVSDVMMPVMDGFELCRCIKENLLVSHIPCILLTARNDPDSTLMGYKTGADTYLAKPFDVDLLLAAIRNCLRRRERTKAHYQDFGHPIVPEKGTFSSADEKFMLRLTAIIEEHISNHGLDVKFIASEIAMSRSSLYSKMKAIAGMGPNEYISKLRIEKAAELLCTTDMSVVEISDMFAFSGQRYFSTVFKRTTGKTPTEYRNRRMAK